MTYSESLREGFRLIVRCWQLVAVQVIMLFLNCGLFFVVVGIPLGIAFVIFGLDLTWLAQTKDLFGILRSPGELLSQYFGLVLLVLAGFSLYVVVVTTLGIYIFGGTIGIMRRAIVDPDYVFGLRDYFDEAKALFSPVLRFTLAVGLAFVATAFVLGFLGGGIAAIISYARSQDSLPALVMGIFLAMVLALIFLFLLFATLAVAVYGVAMLLFRRTGALTAFREPFAFLPRHPDAFWLYTLLAAGYLLASLLFMIIIYPISLIPFVGTLLSFPLQILSAAAQSFLGLVVLATIFIYYRDAAGLRDGEGISAAHSTTADDTSVPQAPGREHTLPDPGQTA